MRSTWSVLSLAFLCLAGLSCRVSAPPSNNLQQKKDSVASRSSESHPSAAPQPLPDSSGSGRPLQPIPMAIPPSYPGGNAALQAYVAASLVVPQIARENGIHGTVLIGFTVNKNGHLSNIRILRGIGFGCDDEAIRVVKFMPDWIPARQGGIAIDVDYALPLNFPP